MGRSFPINRLTDQKGKFERWGDRLESIFGWILIALLTIIVTSTFTQVIFRSILHSPLLWPEEVSRLSYVWISFLGMSLLIRKGALLGVDTLLEIVGRRWQSFFTKLSSILMLIVLVILIWLGVQMIQLVKGQILPATGLSTMCLYAVVPIAGVLSVFFLFEIMLRKQPESDGGR